MNPISQLEGEALKAVAYRSGDVHRMVAVMTYIVREDPGTIPTLKHQVNRRGYCMLNATGVFWQHPSRRCFILGVSP